MTTLTTTGFKDYTLLDTGNGYRLEKVGGYVLQRPDPQCLWKPELSESEWRKADAIFEGDKGDKGLWRYKKVMPNLWRVGHSKIQWLARTTNFKHLGFFPEQQMMWDWTYSILADAQKPPRILNLFAYTGIATLFCNKANAHVTHVDSSKPALDWARENQETAGLACTSTRWILEDVVKFVSREVRRGTKYDGIIMDLPAYGHGADGETWDFMRDFEGLLALCKQLLSPHPHFVLINAYAITASSIMLENMLSQSMQSLNGKIESGELCLKESNSRGFLLSTGIYARWHGK